MPRILMVASEAAPFVKTGGLGDVLGALPPALAKLGNDVAVVLPRYRGVALPRARIWDGLLVNAGPNEFFAGVDEVVRQGVRYLFIDIPALYDRAGIYYDSKADYPDNHVRFAALSQAALGVARYIFRPDIFHAHDWHAALLPMYLRETFGGDPTFFGVRTVFTIHNLGYQGNFPPSALADLALDRALFRPGLLEFHGGLSFLQAGIAWADALTTVSPSYAREIQTPEFGFGMEGLLKSSAPKLTGILNGADYSEWNPETDWRLAARYSAADLSNKRECKMALLREMGLRLDPDPPLAGVISRMAYGQKGMELVTKAMARLVRHGLRLVALGSGDVALETEFRGLASAYPDQIAVRIGYDETLAHRVEAGADMFLMPSRYEPCGLNQIYSLRYGAVPVVRAVGGLVDTVDPDTGFLFHDYSADALASAIGAAIEAYQDRGAWMNRMRLGMSKDFSWDASALQYHRLYQNLLERRPSP
ncbi:MAG TPA: glycogen synthase GlgA [Bryobacteraceae bacterium]|nr:glycogen synthase GlgA [Bryobacteraceae bacterium]